MNDFSEKQLKDALQKCWDMFPARPEQIVGTPEAIEAIKNFMFWSRGLYSPKGLAVLSPALKMNRQVR